MKFLALVVIIATTAETTATSTRITSCAELEQHGGPQLRLGVCTGTVSLQVYKFVGTTHTCIRTHTTTRSIGTNRMGNIPIHKAACLRIIVVTKTHSLVMGRWRGSAARLYASVRARAKKRTFGGHTLVILYLCTRMVSGRSIKQNDTGLEERRRVEQIKSGMHVQPLITTCICSRDMCELSQVQNYIPTLHTCACAASACPITRSTHTANVLLLYCTSHIYCTLLTMQGSIENAMRSSESTRER